MHHTKANRSCLTLTVRLICAACLLYALAGAARANETEPLLKTPRTLHGIRTSAPPAIDGKLDDACWTAAPRQRPFFLYQKLDRTRDDTQAFCVRDEDTLYFAFKVFCSNLRKMRTDAKNRDGAVWEDDSVELFLVPHGPDGVWYQFIVNPLGTLYDARSDRNRRAWNADVRVACRTVYTQGNAGYWAAELAIPFKDLDAAPKENDSWRLNFCHTENYQGQMSTWTHLEGEGFYQPKRFGHLVFGKPSAADTARALAVEKALDADEDLAGAGPAAPFVLAPNVPVSVKKVLVDDCRLLTAFVGAPVDGTLASGNYTGKTAEYPRPGIGAGVSFLYGGNDGLHIALADADGFDLVVLRGGARARMYADATHIAKPGSGRLLRRFTGAGETEVVRFDQRVQARKLSFFNTRMGAIADVGFYRVENGARFASGGERWLLGGEPVEPPAPSGRFAPESIAPAMAERYDAGERRAFTLGKARDGSRPIDFEKNRALHFITEPFDQEAGLAAVTLEAEIAGKTEPLGITVAVQDPLNPRRDITWLECRVAEPGRLRLNLDIPDQVLLAGSRLWLTLRFDADVRLAGPAGGAPEFRLHFVDRARAVPEAIAWRKLLLKSLFAVHSESRPWGNYKGNVTREEFFATQYGALCPELFMTIDQCHAIDPTDALARQYREWVYIRKIKVSELGPPPEPPAGVPAWAWYPRLAWLEFRRMVEWWMDERMVPTGEVGVGVQDDSDFYQQLADMPFFETDGVAAKVKDGVARLAELADKRNLCGGLNIIATDSLHAYEEGLNHLALTARWFYGDPVYLERCMDSARNVEKLTIRTEDGRRHFRDHGTMGYDDTKQPRQPARDGTSSALMFHPTLQYADYNRSPAALKVPLEWANTWLKLMKPRDCPVVVDVRSGEVKNWSGKDAPLRIGYGAPSTFMWLYALTGDTRYIEPFLFYYREGKAPYPAAAHLSEVYALGGLNGGLAPGTLEKLAALDAAAAVFIAGDPTRLAKQARGGSKNWQAAIDTVYDAKRFPDMYTTTHPFTDRVFLGQLQTHPARAYLGGMCKRNKYNPTHAVSWEGFGTDYAALVLKNRRDGLKVLAYSYADKPMTGKMGIWALEHGTYTLAVGPDANGDRKMDRAAQTESLELMRADRVPVTLAPKAVTVIELTQTKKLDPIYRRADLAIAAREVNIEGDTVSGTIHNIGSADVANAVVGIVDGAGRVLVRQALGPLPAPLDLHPKRKTFELALPAGVRTGWRLVLDPDNAVPEIYEGNNAVSLDALPAVDYARAWE
ncbi:MAG: carbohydrate-binding family 9-like protein [Kiritimatiellae bacterium]|nr:carbohydrate-binding family 9-like protein [Kiritimatiellia bacterium]